MSRQYTDPAIDQRRIPSEKYYTNEELIGKYVKIVSNASHKHYGKYGKIVGFAKGDLRCVKVYIIDDKITTKFCRKSLELLTL